MIRTIAPAEMKRVENRVMANTSITGEALMQTAAAYVAEAVRRLRENCGGVVWCVCGTGNNGGDGLAAMRMLAQADADFSGVCWLLPGTLSVDAQRELDRLNACAGEQVAVVRTDGNALPAVPAKVDCVIDALFGTGLSRPLVGFAAAVCNAVNTCGAPVVAVDIPSGLNGDTGAAEGAVIVADATVTFHRPKTGLYLKKGPDFTGHITVADIGLRAPRAAALDDAQGMAVLQKTDLNKLLPKRKRATHKGSYGRVVLLAGSRGMAGAAAIAALAALRSGAGLVTVACPESILDIVQVLCPCATCLPLPAAAEAAWMLLQPALEGADAVGIGCGMGQCEWAADMVRRAAKWLNESRKPAVLDADALNLLVKEECQLNNACIITPHPAEAARLLGTNIRDVLADEKQTASCLYEKYRANTVLKGACSILHDGKDWAINPFGTPAMAKGGSGDALTGIMAALLAGRAAGAYHMDALALMQTACALHGIAGEIAAQKTGERGMLATDLCECIGLVEGETEAEEEITLCEPRNVTVIVEHPAGSREDDERRTLYRLNCGYVQQELDERNEWQDACVLDIQTAEEWYDGVAVAAVTVDGRCVWAIGDNKKQYSRQDVRAQLAFLGNVTDVQMFGKRGCQILSDN